MGTVVTALAAFGAVLALVFVTVYVRRPWWASHTGRILMTSVTMIGVLLAFRTYHRTVAVIPEWAWAGGYLVLDAGLVGLLWLLLHGDPKQATTTGGSAVNPALYSGARTLVQGLVSWLFAHFAVLGQFVDPHVAVEWTLSAVVLGGYVAGVNWLASRTGEDRWSQLARLAAKVLMFGLAKAPAYPQTPPK